MSLFRFLGNRVNRQRKPCLAKYYKTKLSHLKELKPSVWWKEIKKICDMTPSHARGDDLVDLLEKTDNLSRGDFATTTDEAFLLPMFDFVSLPSSLASPTILSRHANLEFLSLFISLEIDCYSQSVNLKYLHSGTKPSDWLRYCPYQQTLSSMKSPALLLLL